MTYEGYNKPEYLGFCYQPISYALGVRLTRPMDVDSRFLQDVRLGRLKYVSFGTSPVRGHPGNVWGGTSWGPIYAGWVIGLCNFSDNSLFDIFSILIAGLLRIGAMFAFFHSWRNLPFIRQSLKILHVFHHLQE